MSGTGPAAPELDTGARFSPVLSGMATASPAGFRFDLHFPSLHSPEMVPA